MKKTYLKSNHVNSKRRLNLEQLERRVVLTGHLITSGVYDENVIAPNTVDRTAPGSTIDVDQFTAEVAEAFQSDQGGVLQGTSVGSFAFWGSYGASHSKTMRIEMVGNNIGIGTLHNAISGTISRGSEVRGAYSSTGSPDRSGYRLMNFDFQTELDGQPIPGGDEGEEVLAFGLTVLSLNGSDYGNMTVVATQSDGSTMTATQAINENALEGDTFYGFRAEPGLSIDSFTLSYDGNPLRDLRIRFDDVGFITGTPDPTIVANIDILPGDATNELNIKKKTFEVAILGSDDLDVSSIDPDSIRFGATGTEDSVQQHRKHGRRIQFEDVNGDGLVDLVAKIETGSTGLTADSVDAALSALTIDGVDVVGIDSVAVRTPGNKQ